MACHFFLCNFLGVMLRPIKGNCLSKRCLLIPLNRRFEIQRIITNLCMEEEGIIKLLIAKILSVNKCSEQSRYNQEGYIEELSTWFDLDSALQKSSVSASVLSTELNNRARGATFSGLVWLYKKSLHLSAYINCFVTLYYSVVLSVT